jgi:hypothetical protein
MLRRIMQAGASENALCGLFFLVIGACGLWFARDLTYGSLRQMGA